MLVADGSTDRAIARTAIKHHAFTITKLDSMCWFSDCLRTGGWHNYITYLCPPRTTPEKNAARRPHPRGQLWKKCCTLLFFVPGDLDLWPWHSNSGDFGTTHL